jgi:hypothetical protein
MKQKNFLKIAMLLVFAIISNFSYGQLVTTIDFETENSGYTLSASEGSTFIDVFNRIDRTGTALGGNSSFLLAIEDLNTVTNPSVTLDQIDVSNSSSFTFSIDMLAHHYDDWDNTDELLITYSVDGGTYQNLMWVQNTGETYNDPAAIDTDFDGDGECGASTTLPSLTTGTGTDGCIVTANTFATFITNSITLSANSTLDIKLQFNGFTAADEGMYIDNIVITETAAASNTTVSFSSTTSTVSENGTLIDVCVGILNEDATTPTTVEVALDGGSTSTNGTDYSSISYPKTLTFPAGSSANQCVTFTLTDDSDIEGDETVVLNLQNVAGGDSAILGGITSHSLTISDDDSPKIEDFTNSNASISYASSNFLGNESITWTYIASRDEGDYGNGSNALMLRRVSDNSKVTSSTISGGIKDFSVKLYKGFTGAGTRQVELFINGVSKGTSIGFDNTSENLFSVNNINIEGDFTIELINTQSGQIIVDDITWNSFSPVTITWNGSDSSDWNTAANWDTNTIPTSADNIVIPEVGTAPIIGATTTSVTNNLTITETEGLTISSGGSLIVYGTSSGGITYNRTLTYDADVTKSWHLVSSPITGEIMTDMRANNSFLTNVSNEISFAPYDNSQAASDDRWSYFGDTATDALENGKGYSAKLSAVGDISFTGTINTSDVSIALTQSSGGSGNDYNLLGNPFTASINSGTFLTSNTSELSQEEIYIWNEATEQYLTKTAVVNFKVPPGQGFFVEANSTNNVTFSKSIQSHEIDDFQKSSRPEIKINISDGSLTRFADIYYISGTTTSFDNGYDGKLFGGAPQPFAIYTHLVSENIGEKYQVQSLPNSNLESMIIPIGANATIGKEITFSTEALNLPTEIKVFLEDRLTNTFTRLDEINSEYKITLTEALNGIGRFYLHTAQSALSTEDVILNSVSIYKTNASTLKIAGLPQGKTSISLYNILGKEMMSTSFISNGNKEISLSKLSSGVYLAKVKTEKGVISKKIILE